MNPIIEIKGIGKKYKIFHQKGRYVALRDVISNALKKPFNFLNKKYSSTETKEGFWALQDISFDVKQGEIVGIIGANGAGKSTLLKILTGITPPTIGEILTRGRVSSLLEVGTGFHPELTGRENIFLNGAILGMKKSEIATKFGEIVSFAGIEKFLDTPVKYYSSGMYVRLAFSIAAHMEPDILLVDEVLAVGDAEFQKKCLGKMEEVTKGGRTILFVSHNMSTIQRLCTGCVLLERGRIKMIGNTKEVTNKYLELTSENMKIPLNKRTDRSGKGMIRFEEIRVKSGEIGDDVVIYLKLKNKYPQETEVKLALNVRTRSTEELISCDTALKGQTKFLPANSLTEYKCVINSSNLNLGTYYLNIGVLHNDQFEDRIQSVAEFSIMAGQFDNHVASNSFPILAKFNWELI